VCLKISADWQISNINHAKWLSTSMKNWTSNIGWFFIINNELDNNYCTQTKVL